MPSRELLHCAVASWYPNFAGVSVKTKLIALPPALVERLVQDGVHLPAESPALIQHRSDQGDLSDWSDDSEEEPDRLINSLAQDFPEVAQAITEAIAELGGAVVPKLNWSCPQDATWITATRSLTCGTADEVLLLLSSSDRIAHDIDQALEACSGAEAEPIPCHLAVRKLQHFRPGREFRCFVRGHELVGVCQRDVTSHFPGLAEQQDELSEIILEFYEQHIELRFPDANYTFDVYVATDGRVRLIDFNPIGFTTQPLLFSWQELGYGESVPPAADNCHANGAHYLEHRIGNQTASSGLAFRLVEAEGGIQPSSIMYGAPYDFVEQNAGDVATNLMTQMQLNAEADEDS